MNPLYDGLFEDDIVFISSIQVEEDDAEDKDIARLLEWLSDD